MRNNRKLSTRSSKPAIQNARMPARWTKISPPLASMTATFALASAVVNVRPEVILLELGGENGKDKSPHVYLGSYSEYVEKKIGRAHV